MCYANPCLEIAHLLQTSKVGQLKFYKNVLETEVTHYWSVILVGVNLKMYVMYMIL